MQFEAEMEKKKVTNEGLHSTRALERALFEPLKSIREVSNIYQEVRDIKPILRSTEIVNLVIADFVRRSGKVIKTKIPVEMYS